MNRSDPDAANANRRPRRRVGVGLLVALGLLTGWIALQFFIAAGGTSDTDGRVAWRSDYHAALSEAERTGRPVLLDFTADWCPPCQWMGKHVYSQPRVAEAIEQATIPVKVDLSNRPPKARKIAEQWQVNTIPTLILLDAAGEPISRATGRLTERRLRHLLDQAPDRRDKPAAATN